MLSTEVEEHVTLMDRVLVFHEGRVFSELEGDDGSRARRIVAGLLRPAAGDERCLTSASVRRFLLERTYSFAILLVTILFVGNLIENPEFVASDQIAGTLAIAAPFVIAAVASTPAILSGGGGIDLSVGPLLGFVNVILVVRLIPEGLGRARTSRCRSCSRSERRSASINGLLVAVVRLQPIVATLGMYLILVGWSLREMPEPIGEAPDWLVDFRGSFGPVPGALILMLVPVVVWILLHAHGVLPGADVRRRRRAGVVLGRRQRHRRAHRRLRAVGGMFAAVAGLALTALIGSGDPTLGPQYTLAAIAAVALGGTSLAGGRGGIIGSILGAFAIFLIRNFLGAVGVAYYWNQVVYGAILLGALILNAVVVAALAPALDERRGGARRGRRAGMSISASSPWPRRRPRRPPPRACSGGEQVARVLARDDPGPLADPAGRAARGAVPVRQRDARRLQRRAEHPRHARAGLAARDRGPRADARGAARRLRPLGAVHHRRLERHVRGAHGRPRLVVRGGVRAHRRGWRSASARSTASCRTASASTP